MILIDDFIRKGYSVLDKTVDQTTDAVLCYLRIEKSGIPSLCNSRLYLVLPITTNESG